MSNAHTPSPDQKNELTPLTWSTQKRKIADLIPYDKNPRKMSPRQEEKLKQSLERFNLVEIPAIDVNHKIISGHQRLRILHILGRSEELIDVRIPNRKLTEEEYRDYLLTSNAVTGDWKYDELKEFDIPLLEDIGFDPEVIEKIWSDDLKLESVENFDVVQELNNIKVPQTRKGDLILLGSHRLVCGNSNDEQVLQKLFGDDTADMIFSDPIYNLSVNYRTGIGGNQDFGADVEDTRTEEEYTEFLRQNMRTALTFTKHDSHIFYWNTEQNIYIVQNLYKEFGVTNRRVCLWIKNAQNETPLVAFSKCYEPAIYGTRGRPYITKSETGLNEILNPDITAGNESVDSINIWTAKRVSASELKHATQKPIDLYKKAIRRCTKIHDIILDSFGGSGSLLCACEDLKRRAYVVELEPIFCDLIIARYKKMTGKEVVIIRDDETK